MMTNARKIRYWLSRAKLRAFVTAPPATGYDLPTPGGARWGANANRARPYH
jgi:hypothetical protein